MNSQGAASCHQRTGARNTAMAQASARVRKTLWRIRNQAALLPAKRLASAVAMEAEYTITRPMQESSSAAQASERSYSALGALRANT